MQLLRAHRSTCPPPPAGRGRARATALTGVAFAAALSGAAPARAAGQDRPAERSAMALPSATIDACSQATETDSAFAERLADAGWQPVEPTDRRRFVSLFADGVAAATADGALATPQAWRKALAGARQLADMLLRARDAGAPILVLITAPDNASGAALAAFVQPGAPGEEGSPDVLRCLYSGPSDKIADGLVSTVARADAASGRVQPAPGLRIATMDTTGNGMLTSLRLARLAPEISSLLARAPRAELGFSLFRAPQR